MKLEIINPSDKAYMYVDNFKTGCVATILVLGPEYGLKEKEPKYGRNKMPPTFLLHNSRVITNDWFKDEFNQDFIDAYNETDLEDITKVLKSVELAGERTSLNNFTKKCHEMADQIEEKMDDTDRDILDTMFEGTIEQVIEE